MLLYRKRSTDFCNHRVFLPPLMRVYGDCKGMNHKASRDHRICTQWWWYVAPTIINTFLEAYDFSGKKITLFATSGGSGFGKTVQELQPSAPGAEIREGKLLNGGSKQEIEIWVKSL